ncbi:MAG: hypothetical protein KC591_06945 [Gemmatimonadetes bacterium]|nr:hypothetical protein [Gemmatimonadota bacterium]
MSERIRQFFREVSRCRQCYGAHDILVPAPDEASEKARILIVGEQPHRDATQNDKGLGAHAEDPTVSQLTAYLEEAGVAHSEILYVTAVMCVPVDESLRPGRPTLDEARACSRHLRRLITILKPRLVIPLGHTAVQAVQACFPEWTELRQYILNYDVGRVLEGRETTVYPLYLASPSTLQARPEMRQRRDWARIPSILNGTERRATAGN